MPRDSWPVGAGIFGIAAMDWLPGLPVGRVVAATELACRGGRTRVAFVERPGESTIEALSRYSSRGGTGREIGRWLRLAVLEHGLVPPGVLELAPPTPPLE